MGLPLQTASPVAAFKGLVQEFSAAHTSMILSVSLELAVAACQSLIEIDLHHQFTLPVSQCEFPFRSLRTDMAATILWDLGGVIYPHP